jgi:hypothetical protein
VHLYFNGVLLHGARVSKAAQRCLLMPLMRSLDSCHASAIVPAALERIPASIDYQPRRPINSWLLAFYPGIRISRARFT